MTGTTADPCSASAPRRVANVRLLRRDSLGNGYHLLRFDDPEQTAVQPGQFAMLRCAGWGDAPLLARPMSYLDGGPPPSILLKVQGEGTSRMGRAQAGDPFTLVGPLGRPWRAPASGRRPLLVAGGVGVAPLLYLARTLARSGLRPLAIYGGRTGRDLPLVEELGEVAEPHLCTEDGSRGHRGLVTDVLAGLLDGDVDVFTCGPEPMMARVAEMCAAVEVPCEVSLEAPMACGFGVCLGCAVPTTDGKYLYACTEGPCIDARRVDWRRSRSARGAGQERAK